MYLSLGDLLAIRVELYCSRANMEPKSNQKKKTKKNLFFSETLP
jgi:hypothetical protein